MPFIDSKITVAVDAAKKEELKAELGKLMATLHKSETAGYPRGFYICNLPSDNRLGLEREQFLSGSKQ